MEEVQAAVEEEMRLPEADAIVDSDRKRPHMHRDDV